jgi:hypothetical protein
MKALLVYAALGLLVAVLCDRRQGDRPLVPRLGSIALSLLAWPLWGPVALLQQGTDFVSAESPLLQRCKLALAEARGVVQGTALDGLLPERLTAQLLRSLSQVEGRHAELSQLLSRPEFQARADQAGRPRARAHEENVRRLHELRQRDERLLDEIAELAEALRTQLLVARYSGAQDPGANVGDLLSALSTRVESMDAWFELDNSQPSVNTQG